MRRLKSMTAMGLAFFAVLASTTSAVAGLYSDEMARCLVKFTSTADRNVLVRWMFAAAALHPEVRSLVSVSDGQRDELNKSMAKILERLLLESCRSQAQEAAKYEGRSAFEASFNVLGQVAGRELFADPNVGGSMANVLKYLDKQKMDSVFGSVGK